MNIRLLVLHTNDTKTLAGFYGVLGLNFVDHRHGNSPYHYSATIGQTVLEIYPLTMNQSETDTGLRLGFEIDNFDKTLLDLKEMDVPFLSEPMQTEFGFMAIVSDPDGRTIELYKN